MGNIDEGIVAQYFYKGAEVEISSKDEGFEGSWYAGTVLSHRKSKRNSCMKVLVKYKTLLMDDGTRRLREEVDAIQLRPAPPQENRCRFESSENVDAYYHDGWWEGVITEVLREDKYKVFFRGSREQRNFKASRLRRHHEWALGKWLPPFEPGFNESPPLKRQKAEEVSMSTKVKPKKKTIDNNFSQGTTIKVNSDEYGFQDALFAATSTKKSGPSEVSMSTKVKPKKKTTDNNFSPGTMIVVNRDEDGFQDASFAATSAKKSGPSEISMSTKVKPKRKTTDNNFSPGTTIIVNSDEDGFEDASFAATSAKKSGPSEVSVATEMEPNEEITSNNFHPGTPIEVSSDEDGFEGAWFPATILKKLDNDKYLIEYQTLRNNNDTEFLKEEVDSLHIRPCPPDIELLDRFEVLEKVEAFYNDIWWVGVISKVRKYDEYNVYFKSSDEELRFNHSLLRAAQEWINGKWVFPPKACDL